MNRNAQKSEPEFGARLDARRRELGAIWRRHTGDHYPAMSMIFVSDLLDHPGRIELETTAIVS